MITDLLEVLISLTTKESLDSSFLMRCASSITMYFQLNFLKTLFSRKSISYEVTTTSHPPGIIVSRINLLRVSWSPMRHTALLMKKGVFTLPHLNLRYFVDVFQLTSVLGTTA